MLLRIVAVLIVVSYFISCDNVPPNEVTTSAAKIDNLINHAENKQHTDQQRLLYALSADSLATTNDLKEKMLYTKRLIAGLYLSLGDKDLALPYFNKAAQLAQVLSDKESLGICWNNVGIIYNEKGIYDSALKYYYLSNSIFRLKNDKLRTAQGLINIGIVYKTMGNYNDAFKTTLEGTKILDSIGANENLAAAYTNLGNIVKNLGNTTDALHYHEIALKLRLEQKDSSGIAGSLNNIGNIYLLQKDNINALVYFKKSLAIKERLHSSKSLATTIDNVGQVYANLKEYDKARSYYYRALALRTEYGDREGAYITLNEIASMHIAQNDLVKAKQVAINALTTFSGVDLKKQKLDNVLMLFKISQKLYQFDSAVKYADLALNMRDSVFSTEMGKEISTLNLAFRSDEKEKEIILSRQVQTKQTHQIRTQQYFIILLLALSISLILLAYLKIRSNKTIKRANHRIELLMNELNHRVKNNLQIVSDMLQLQLHKVQDKQHIVLIQASIDRVHAMNIIHGLLYEKGYNGSIGIRTFLSELISNLSFAYFPRSKDFQIDLRIADIDIDINKAISLGIIINELVTNFFKYARPVNDNPCLEIVLEEKDAMFKLTIDDNCATWDIIVERTAKKGLGLLLIETLAEQLGAVWESSSSDNNTRHQFYFSK